MLLFLSEQTERDLLTLLHLALVQSQFSGVSNCISPSQLLT